jgi:hypothetical protein
VIFAEAVLKVLRKDAKKSEGEGVRKEEREGTNDSKIGLPVPLSLRASNKGEQRGKRNEVVPQ